MSELAESRASHLGGGGAEDKNIDQGNDTESNSGYI